jgi:predicted outer membrane repeat protein
VGVGIYALSTPTTLTNVTITDNYSDSSGGVGMIALGAGGTLDLENVLFHNNVTESNDSSAGGLLIFGGIANPTLTNVTFSQNKAEIHGGALYMADVDNPVLTDVHFIQNEAKYSGGALYMEAVQNAVLSNVVFTENEAKGVSGVRVSGGAVHSEDSSATYINVQFNRNISERAFGSGGSGGYGGALYVTGEGNTNFSDVIFSGNETRSTLGGSGGAIYLGHDANATFRNATFSGNSTLEGAGGAIYGQAHCCPINFRPA